ncbi:MAG: recombinase family protein [Clostridia bacterium]|nr:recombinase family protein [Clostridia bacterium]
MRVWLYCRLSRDEDRQLNSLNNQRRIVEEYANSKGYEIVGESSDDNVSGMHFDRGGIEKLQEEAERKTFDAVIVKDLSRLGRHKILTAMFIDNLKRLGIRVLSATEGIDTFNEDDDLMIGFKSLINDSYCRDMSRKIRAGYRQKQKNGIVIIPPMGYRKDRNTGKVEIIEEQAQIVRRIFGLYLSGYGIKAIAGMLNSEGVRSQGYYQEITLGKKIGWNKPEIAHRFLWENTKIKRIIENEFYCGTLVCHQTYTNKIDHVRKAVPPEERFRHENAVPAIVDRETWERAQELMKDKNKRNVRASPGRPFHRYTGLITCADCGSCFVCKKRRLNGVERYEYVCGGYHRFGKENCTPHCIRESDLDRIVTGELTRIKDKIRRDYATVEEDVRKWISGKGKCEVRLNELEKRLSQRKEDQQNILLERIRDREHADVYAEMLKKCEEDIKRITETAASIRDCGETVRRRKEEMKNGMSLIDGILAEGAISDTGLRMLVDGITVGEKDGKLSVTINLKGDFRHHLDVYENGEITERFFEAYDLPDDEGTSPEQIPYDVI